MSSLQKIEKNTFSISKESLVPADVVTATLGTINALRSYRDHRVRNAMRIDKRGKCSMVD